MTKLHCFSVDVGYTDFDKVYNDEIARVEFYDNMQLCLKAPRGPNTSLQMGSSREAMVAEWIYGRFVDSNLFARYVQT